VSEHEDEKDARPWEQPGQDRRDLLPERGERLLFWAQWGFFCSSISWCVPPAALVGVYICLVVAIRSRLDLAEIARKTRERAGKVKTRRALFIALPGVVVGLVFCVIWGVLILWGVAFVMTASAWP
jgi:hypothetical protein